MNTDRVQVDMSGGRGRDRNPTCLTLGQPREETLKRNSFNRASLLTNKGLKLSIVKVKHKVRSTQ